MGRLRQPTRKKVMLRRRMLGSDPGGDRVARLLGDLESNRPLGLLLHDDCSGRDVTAPDYAVDAKPDRIAPPQLALTMRTTSAGWSCLFLDSVQLCNASMNIL